MAFKLKSGNTSSFKKMGSSAVKQKFEQKVKIKATKIVKSVDPDAPGTPGTPGYEPTVKSTDYLMKTPNPTTASDSAKKKYENEDATTFSKPAPTKQRRTGKFVVKDGKKVYQENEKELKGDDGYGGEGFMQPPYRYPAGPTEKRKGYHGYKPKEINFNKKVMVDGETNALNKAKIKANKATFDKLSQAEKDKLQKAANEKRAKFEASDEYKKRTKKK